MCNAGEGHGDLGQNATKLEKKYSCTNKLNLLCLLLTQWRWIDSVDCGIKLRSARVAPYFILGVFKVLRILTNHTQFCWA